MITFREFLNMQRKDDVVQHLKDHIASLYDLDNLDITKLGKYLLDKFYNLSLFDNSNLVSPIDAKKLKVPGTDRYNFNNTLYYKYNYDKYNFRHPMDLDDVFDLIDKIYKRYGKDNINEIYDYLKTLETYNDNDIENVKTVDD